MMELELELDRIVRGVGGAAIGWGIGRVAIGASQVA